MKNIFSNFKLLIVTSIFTTTLGVFVVSAKQPPSKQSSLVLITNWGSDSVSLIDIEGGKELAKIPVGIKPYDIKVEKTGRFAYASASGADYISVIDIQAMLENKTARIKVGESPRDIDLTLDNKRAVVANAGSNSISILDLVAKKELYKVPVCSIPYGVALTNNDRWAVITCWGSNKAAIVELNNNKGKLLKEFNVGSLPYTVVVPDGSNYALISCFGSNHVDIIDLKKLAVGRAIKVGSSPWGLSASSDGKKALVANFYSGDASVLTISKPLTDPLGATSPIIQETARIPLKLIDPLGASAETRARAKNAAFSADPNIAVMTNLGSNEVMVLNINKQQIVKTISVGQAPYGVAFIPRN